MALLDNKVIQIICSGLEYPEGPIHCKNGSILLVEIMGERLSRISPDGKRSTVAKIPGGPNGAAAGPDGQIYVCNDGGFDWIPIPPPPARPVLWIGGNQPKSYKGGSLDKVDVNNGEVCTLFTECAERLAAPTTPWNPPFKLRGPDDLVFDSNGGLWFTDYGKIRERERDITAVYYVSPGGKSIQQMIYPLNSPNGIGLSPGGDRLYVALTFERRILYYELDSPGVIKPNPKTIDGSYLLTADLPGQALLDSLALDIEGNVYVATMLPEGNDPLSNGGISIISPDGDVDYVPIDLGNGLVAPLPSNICFGGDDMKTAFITCGAAGHLISMPATIPGLKLEFDGSSF